MAKVLLPLVVLITALLCLFHMTQAETASQALNAKDETFAARKNSYSYINCGSACDYRCSKASLHKRCLKYCNICCSKCQCVPPGTAGNREVCPCYNQLMNSRGGHKCP